MTRFPALDGLRGLIPVLILLAAVAIYLKLAPLVLPAESSWKGCQDWNCYLSIARDIRHFDFSWHPIQTIWGQSRSPWFVFPPGFSLAIALFPAKITLNSGVLVAQLSFSISIIFVYLIGLRRSTLSAILSAILWALAVILCTDLLCPPRACPSPIHAPWSDMTFIALLLSAIYVMRPWLKGGLLAFAAMTRPEAYLALPLILLFSKNKKTALIIAVSFGVILSPYLALLWAKTGKPALTPPDKSFAWVRAPYFLAGIPLRKLPHPWPKPGSKELAKVANSFRSQECLRLTNPFARVTLNLQTALSIKSLWPVILLGLAGIVAAIKQRDWKTLQIAAIIFSTGLLWPFWTFEHRFFDIWLLAFAITSQSLWHSVRQVLSSTPAPRLEAE